LITALSLLEQGFRDLTSPIAFVRAGGFFENFLYGLQVAQGGALGRSPKLPASAPASLEATLKAIGPVDAVAALAPR
jgi:hypothetical protein